MKNVNAYKICKRIIIENRCKNDKDGHKDGRLII